MQPPQQTQSLAITVPTHHIVNSKYALFHLQVSFRSGTTIYNHIITRRHSELTELHQYLSSDKNVHPCVASCVRLFTFPPKTLLKRLDNRFLNGRRKLLSKYFYDLATNFFAFCV